MATELGGLDIHPPTDNSPGKGDSGASAGVLAVTSDPPNRYPGMIWYRSDLSQISVETGGGVVKRVTVA